MILKNRTGLVGKAKKHKPKKIARQIRRKQRRYAKTCK